MKNFGLCLLLFVLLGACGDPNDEDMQTNDCDRNQSGDCLTYIDVPTTPVRMQSK